MMGTKNNITSVLCFFAVTFILLPNFGAQTNVIHPVPAQSTTQTETGRDERGTLKSIEFTGSRLGGSNPNTGLYRFRQRMPEGRIYSTIGVTIGRGRPATESENRNNKIAKVRSHEGLDLVLERASDDAAVTDGTLMQIIIEYLASRNVSGIRQSNRVGYLYVINREEYPNGKYGPPSLIFPTRHTYGGDSRVLPGKTATLPVPDRVWKVSRSISGTVQEFETYIIIISPQPLRDSSGRVLQGYNLSERPLKIDEKLVAQWIRLWGGNEWRGDLENGVGQLVTQRERNASGNPSLRSRSTNEESSDLTRDDPPPQIVFRKVVRPGGAMLVTIKLPFKK